MKHYPTAACIHFLTAAVASGSGIGSGLRGSSNSISSQQQLDSTTAGIMRGHVPVRHTSPSNTNGAESANRALAYDGARKKYLRSRSARMGAATLDAADFLRVNEESSVQVGVIDPSALDFF